MSITVIKAATTARLTSLENVCIELGKETGTALDRRIDRFIDNASAMAASYCERTFGRAIYRERLLSVPADGKILTAGPVNRIISVGIQGGAVYGEGDYLLSDGKLLLTHGATGGMGDGSAWNLYRSLQPALIVEYEAGWVLPEEKAGDVFTGVEPLPYDIERAAIQLVGVMLSESGRDATIKEDTVEGVGSRSFYVQGTNARLPHPGAEAALEHHRVVHLA